MDFQGISGNFTEAGVDALAIAVFKDEKASSSALKDLDKLTGGAISGVIKSEFKGETGETCLLRLSPKGRLKASRLLLVGVGERNEFRAADIAVAAGSATRALRKSNAKSVAFSVNSDVHAVDAAQHAAQGTRQKTRTIRP
jgi:leucyl aminopeptidase